MEITCISCKKPFKLNALEIGAAMLDYSLGHSHTFGCDHCQTKNTLTKAAFETAKDAFESGTKPVAAMPAAKPAIAPAPAKPAMAKPAAAMPTAKPMVAAHGRDDDAMPKAGPRAEAGMTVKGGTVLVASLHVRKDHSTTSETVRGLVKGDKVTISTTWSDGTNTWAQIGANEWAAVEHGGKKMIELN